MEQAALTRSSGKGWKLRSKEEIFGAIAEFEKAGNISPKEFARMHEITETTFYNWRKRYRSGKKEPGGFVPVRIRTRDYSPTDGLFAKVCGIEIYQWVEAAYLKELLG